MSGPTLTIPEETMRGLIGQAILTAIDEEARTALLQSAINYLVAPTKTDRYASSATGPSTLESAFRQALDAYARGYVQEWMASDDAMATAMREQLDGLFAAYQTQLSDGTFREALNGWVIEWLSDPERRRR